MKLKVVIVLMLCLSFFSLVSASTTLKIQTLPDHEIFITEIDAFQSGDVAVTQPIKTFSGKRGLIELEHTPQKNSFKLGLLLKDGSKKAIKYTVLEDIFHDNEVAEIEFLPKGITLEDVLASIEEEPIEEEPVEEVIEEIVSNESEIEEANESKDLLINTLNEEVEEVVEEEEVTEESSGIFKDAIMQGAAVLRENKPVVNIVSYGIIALIVTVPLFLFVKKRKGLISEKFGKMGNILPKSKNSTNSDEDDFKKAEADLKKARERIDELKGDKIKKARQKLLEDEKELMRLRNLGKD